MIDPYGVLGLDPSASDEAVKKAYRELARKYHPDNYHNNPLSDLAQEKMKEINEAYDIITKQRAKGGRSGGYPGGNRSQSGYEWGGGTSSRGSSDIYTEIRNTINMGDLLRGEQLLNTITDRGAEWHFLMGGIYYKKGWIDEAGREFQLAVHMDPTNAEYQEALGYMRTGGRAYRAQRSGPVAGSSNCDCCTTLLCADCCCECMGGDLISCC